MFGTIFNTVFPTFMLIFIGWVYVRLRPQCSTKSLNHLALYVGITAIIIKSLADVKLADMNITFLAGASTLAFLLPLAVGLLWFKFAKVEQRGLILPIAFINAVNLPLPIINLGWGNEGVAAATVYFTTHNIFLFIFGVMLIAKENKVREVFRQPFIYAFVVALIINLTGTKLPTAVDNMLKLCVDMAMGLMLIVMGIVLGRSFTKAALANIRLSLTAALIRIVVGICAGFIVVAIFSPSGISREIGQFYSIMPGAIATTLFAEKYERDSELVAQAVFFGSLISMLLIPFAMYLIK